jgi:hypothetical protein
VGHSTQLDGTFGDQVGDIVNVAGYVVKQQVQLMELEALDVPVRVLDLGFHVNGVSQARVEKIDEFGLDVVRKIDTAGEADIRFSFCRHKFS